MANVSVKTNGAGQDVSKRISETKRELGNAIKEYQFSHDHKNKHGACLESVHQTKQYIKDKGKLGPDAVICKECGEIFEMTAYTESEVEAGIMMFKSMLNQIKVLANLQDEEYADIVSVLEFVDTKLGGTLAPYYLNMIKRLGDNNNRRKDTNQKGRIGGLGGSYGASASSFR